MVRKTVYTKRQLTNAHGFVYDDDGNRLWAETIQVAETRGPNLNAALALMRQSSAELLLEHPPNPAPDPDRGDGMDDPTIRRLSESIRMTKEELEAQEAFDRRDQTGHEASATSPVSPIASQASSARCGIIGAASSSSVRIAWLRLADGPAFSIAEASS